MLPHGAFVRAHERLAQVVLASGSRQHVHQQVEESRARTHGRHVTERGFPEGKGPPWVQRWDVLTWNSCTGGQVKTSHNFATVMLSFTPRGKSQIYRKNVHVFCCYEVEGNSCKASLLLCVLFALRGQVLLLCVWTPSWCVMLLLGLTSIAAPGLRHHRAYLCAEGLCPTHEVCIPLSKVRSIRLISFSRLQQLLSMVLKANTTQFSAQVHCCFVHSHTSTWCQPVFSSNAFRWWSNLPNPP